MGLDTTHNAWHGAYSAFNRWRGFLAELVGFEVTRERYQWHGNDIGFERHKPLAYLLGHSDCDGSIPVEAQIPLAEYLERLIAEYPDADLFGHVGGWHAKTKQFADGLRLAHSLGEEVEFR